MAIKQVTAAELKLLDPKRFEKKYWAWTEYALWDDWYEYIEGRFKEAMAAQSCLVDNIEFTGIGGQGGSAGFYGSIKLADFMRLTKVDDVPLAELYPALFLAVEGDQSFASIGYHDRRGSSVEFNESTYYTVACGVFAGLDDEAWDELIESQWVESDLVVRVESWVKDQCGDLTRDLEAEYESITSEESFLESCECNEITFELEIEDEAEFCG